MEKERERKGEREKKNTALIYIYKGAPQAAVIIQSERMCMPLFPVKKAYAAKMFSNLVERQSSK